MSNERTGGWARGFVLFALLIALGVALTSFASSASADSLKGGAVYTITDSPAGNQVLVFERSHGGALEPAGAVDTGGTGTGGALGSQGALALSGNGRYIVAVNGGSSTVSLLAVRPHGLDLLDVVPAQGATPVSVTIDGGTVYVVNNGSDSIAGFEIAGGSLVAIPGSVQSLPAGSEPGQVSFTPDGDTLVVSVKNLSLLVGFPVDGDVAGPGVSTPSAAPTPFGFAIDRFEHAIVSEAPGSDVSSYAVDDDGTITLLDGPVANGQVAACWVALSKDGRFAYSANAGSSNISSYRVHPDGDLELVEAVAGVTAGNPLDLAVSNDGRYLYALSPATGSISEFEIARDGTLTFIGAVSDVSMVSASGLAAK